MLAVCRMGDDGAAVSPPTSMSHPTGPNPRQGISPCPLPTLTQPTIAVASSAESEPARGEICGGYGDNSTTALSAACSCLRDCWLSSSGTRDDDGWAVADRTCPPAGFRLAMSR